MADWSFKGWKGHHTKLFDAQSACKNTDSSACEPFLAAAVAVADVFSEIAKPDEKGDLIVTFPDAVQERCSSNFRQRMNGQTLLYRALALTVGSERLATVVPFGESSSDGSLNGRARYFYGAADRSQRSEAAGAVAQDLIHTALGGVMKHLTYGMSDSSAVTQIW